MRPHGHRWHACLTAMLVLFHCANCFCLHPVPDSSAARPAVSAHACCSRTSHASRPGPADDRRDCPHCHPSAVGEVAARHAVPSPFDFLTALAPAGPASAPLPDSTVDGGGASLDRTPPLQPPTLLSLHCALTT